MDEAIVSYIKKEFNLMIGDRTAEQIKMTVGTAYVDENTEEASTQIKGRDLVTGLPKIIEITNYQVAQAIREPVNGMVEAIKYTLEKTPPELAADIMDTGITLSGGGALLKELDTIIHKETGLTVNVAENPLDCVVNGTGKVLENLDQLQNVLISSKRSH